MEFFNTKHPIRKIGQDEYVIGSQPLNPLVRIKGQKIITKEIDADIINLQTGFFDHLSGNFLDLKTGQIDFLNLQTGFFDHLSGNFLDLKTGQIDFLDLNQGSFNYLSGNELILRGLDVYEELNKSAQIPTGEISQLSGNINSTGLLLNQKIDSVSGQLNYKIEQNLGSGDRVILENYYQNRILLEEAFEYDEYGDVVPTNYPYISDTMWILKDDNNLELRANIFRYDTGPEAFTKDISF